MMERRKEDRHPTEPLDVITLRTEQDVEYLCSVQNVSRTGFRAEVLGGPVHVLPELGAGIVISDCPENLIDLLCSNKGRIAWTTINAMGVELLEEITEDDPELKDLLESRSLTKWSDWEI